MITQLGIAAGEIWHFLDEHGQSALSALVSGLDKSRDIILMSLGWLAREGHVRLTQQDGDFTIKLSK